jgi:hypothetical protein
MFVNSFFLTHIRYQIMGSEIVLKPAYQKFACLGIPLVTDFFF